MRPREFNEIKIAEAAMQVFWKMGYSATSIEDIVQGTGLGRGSLYNTFGSKYALYKLALNRYYEITAINIALLSEEDTVFNLMHRLMMKIVSEELNDTDHLGCMVANAALELGRYDEEIAKLVSKNLNRLETAITSLIVRGQLSGEIKQSKNPEAIAGFMVNTIQGIRVVSQGTSNQVSEKKLTDIVNVALEVLK